MTKIWLSRFGEKEHAFELDDIKKGAVRDSGLFPELYKSRWPAVTSGALVTGVERKFEEHRFALEDFDFPLFLPAALLSRALEDSKEAESTKSSIARSKLHKGFIAPIFNHVAGLTGKLKKQFYNSIASRAHLNRIQNLVAIADDRSLRSDPVFLEPLYGELRKHSNAQVREIFQPGHDIPGQRVKEVDGARQGVFNSVFLWHQVVNDLREQGVQFDSRQYLDTTLCFVPVVPGKLPLPEQGLIVRAEGRARTLRPIGESDVERLRRGRIFTYDHFDQPCYEGVPDWMTLRDYKRAIADDQTPDEREKYEGVNTGPIRTYLKEVHSPAAAMRAFAYAVRMPGIEKAAQNNRPASGEHRQPKTVWTSSHFVTDRPDERRVYHLFGKMSGYKLSRMNGGLHHLRNLEEAAYSGQAFAVIDPRRFDLSRNRKKKTYSVDEKNTRLLQDLETSLIYAYLITMSTQPGALNHIGRPHLVDKMFYKRLGRWHPDLCNLGLTGDAEREAYWLWKDPEGFAEGLSRFDKNLYHHSIHMPKNSFMNEEQVKQLLGVDDLGFVVANYGSASSFSDKAYRYPFRLVYALSQMQSVTTVDGGGSRSAMLGMRDGALRAMREGYKILNIGIRSEGDVSPLEGSSQDWFDKNGLVQSGGDHKKYVQYENGQMHVIKMERILPRQAAIAALANVATISDGGKGTVLEFFITALHNARVHLTGSGLFEGFASNTRITPLVVLNRETSQAGVKRGIFDRMLEPWRQDFGLLGVQEFSGVDPVPAAVQWIKNYGTHLGFDLRVQDRALKARHGIDLV